MTDRAQDDERVMSLVERTLALPTAQREAYLKNTCSDQNLFNVVWSYVRSEERMKGFLLKSAESGQDLDEYRFQPGDILDHRFRIVREVAQGGMGVVYEAIDERLERRIALKCAKAGYARQLSPEVRHASEIGHPNVCKIFEIHSAETPAGPMDFITMEFLDGETLAMRLRRGSLAKSEAQAIAMELCAGVAEAHCKGVIHGDLKTNNVILAPVGNAKSRAVITDFGLARNKAASLNDHRSGLAGGTPHYMAPELLRGEKASVSSDIYALGVIFCEMFGSCKLEETLAFSSKRISPANKSQDHDASTLREHVLTRRRLPVRSKWDRVLLRCLAPDPSARFKSADDLLKALSPIPIRRWMLSAGFLALVALSFLILWRQNSSTSYDASPLPLTQLTAGAVDSSVSLSPDAKKVVYSSDASGNLNLWLRDLAGGEPVRLTNEASSETDAIFSPDGRSVAFRSDRAGGGIFVTSIPGNKQLLIGPGGRDPSYSPDGKWIAYWQGLPSEGDVLRAGSAKTFVAPATGGVPRQLASDLVNAGYPVFSPDGQYLLVRGQLPSQEQGTYFLVSLATGKSKELAFAKEFEGLGLSHALIQAWTKAGIFFRAGHGDESNIWYAPVSANLRLAGHPRLLAASTSETSHVSVSGRKLAFFNGERQNLIWLLPIEANSAKILGPIRRVVSPRPGVVAHPDLSPDGKRLLFRVFSSRGVDLVLRNLETGDERLVAQADKPELAGRFLGDNSTLLFETGGGDETSVWRWDLMSGRSAELRKHASALGASADGRWISYWKRNGDGSNSVWIAEPGTGPATEILNDHRSQLYVQHFSPDGRWMSFIARNGPEHSRIFIAPFRGRTRIAASNWIPVSPERSLDDKPEWSPDGNLLYFLSDRDGYRCVWAQRLMSASKRPLGPSLPVQHFHELRSSIQGVNLGHQALSVSVDKLAFLVSQQSGGIWIADLPRDIP